MQKLNEPVQLVATKKQIKQFASSLSLILDTMREHHWEKDVTALRIAHLRLLEATKTTSSDDEAIQIHRYLGTHGIELTTLRSDVRLNASGVKERVDVLKSLVNLLDDDGNKTTRRGIQIHIKGQRSDLYPILLR
jgi:hypothetical protein